MVSQTFRFKHRTALLILLGLILTIFFGLGLAIAMQDALVPGLFFIFGTFIVLFFPGAIAVLGKADLTIDEEKICRCLFGRTLQALPWADVALVRVFPMQGVRKGRAFNILRKGHQVRRAFRAGKVYFVDDCIEMGALIELLNHCIRLHGIQVENEMASPKANTDHI